VIFNFSLFSHGYKLIDVQFNFRKISELLQKEFNYSNQNAHLFSIFHGESIKYNY